MRSGRARRLGSDTSPWDRALDRETEPEKWRTNRDALWIYTSRSATSVYLVPGADGSPMYVKASGRPVFDFEWQIPWLPRHRH